jgi:RibD domain-containing protein
VVTSANTRIEREFDPAAIRRLKATAEHDIIVGGPELARGAIEAGLVDEYHLFVVPVVVGGGKRPLPDGVCMELELLHERRFRNGTVYLHYRRRSSDRDGHARGSAGSSRAWAVDSSTSRFPPERPKATATRTAARTMFQTVVNSCCPAE